MSPILARLPYYCALLAGLVAAMFLGTALGSDDYLLVILASVSLFSAIWIIMSGEWWWVPMGFALGIGGYFTIPWKLYPHEMALALCGLAILPRIPFKPAGLRKYRPALPTVFFALFGYLVAQYVYSAFREWNTGGLGNISRAYLNALWPFIFGSAFYWYGSSKVIGAAFRAMYLALVIRMAFGFVNYYFEENFIVPLVNYTIDPQDLRASGTMLLILSTLMLVATRGPIARVGHAIIVLFSLGACLIGGSRAQIAALFLYPLILCVIFRRWTLLSVSTAVTGLLVVAVNLSPQTLESLPYRMQRGLSVLIVGPTIEIDVQQDVKGSDEFRSVISAEGRKRWSENARTLLFGTGIRRFDENVIMAASRFELDPFTLMIQVAADVGGYETTIWTLLAVLGLVGLLLYAGLFLAFLRRILPALSGTRFAGSDFVVVAWATIYMVGVFLTCALFGGFPSFEIFLGVLALAIIQDRRTESAHIAQIEARTEAEPATTTPMRGFTRPRTPAPRRIRVQPVQSRAP